MILVTTAGKVGTQTARTLAERAVPVRVLTRDPRKVAALADCGVQIVQGDRRTPRSPGGAARRRSRAR